MFFKPKVEQLDQKITPARLLTVSAEAQAILEDVDRLYEMPTEEMQALLESILPIKQDFCYVVEVNHKDGNLWDGPILDPDKGPESENRMVYLWRSDGNFPEDYPQAWFFGAIVDGCGDNQTAYTEMAAAWGCNLYELTTTLSGDKQLVDNAIVTTLQNALVGDEFDGSYLTNSLELDVLSAGVEGFTTDPDTGELIGDGILTLKLGIVNPDGGFQLFTLKTALDEFNLHSSWTLTGNEFVQILTPDVYELVSR